MSNPLTPDPRYPHGPEGYQLRLMVTRGEMEEAQSFLDALNHSRKVFGHPLLEMPPPFELGLPDLCAVDARATAIVERDLRFTLELQDRSRAA